MRCSWRDGSWRLAPSRGLDLGYCRVSTSRQSVPSQLDALTGAGIPLQRIYRDKQDRGQRRSARLTSLLGYAGDNGDTIIVHTLDRLGSNLREVLNLVHELSGKGIGMRSWQTRYRSTPPSKAWGRLAFLLLARFAEMERTYTAERTTQCSNSGDLPLLLSAEVGPASAVMGRSSLVPVPESPTW